MKPKPNPHAVALGKIKSAKKAAASRENGKKGGRKRNPLLIPINEAQISETNQRFDHAVNRKSPSKQKDAL